MINQEATNYLKSLKRIASIEEAQATSDLCLYLPEPADFTVDHCSNVKVYGLDSINNIKAKDLLTVIKVNNAILADYKITNVLSPSSYVHSLPEKPWHITTQGFLVTRMTDELKHYISSQSELMSEHYGRHEMDQFWLPCSKKLFDTTSADLTCIFNRRVSGWDGSMERPVIELLGAGGHLQAVWNSDEQCFQNRSLEDNLIKEFDEEIGLELNADDIRQVGGFINNKTQELVIFSCIYIAPEKVPEIQKYALHNVDEDTDGIYLGTFSETMNAYRQDASYFAGGNAAAQTNFPNNSEIMHRIIEMYSSEK